MRSGPARAVIAAPPSVRRTAADYTAWLAPLTVTLLGAALRILLWLDAYPLHHDEALYGTWARMIASGQDPLLLSAWVDKPPLVLYLIAGSFRLSGVSTLALRLPGVVAAILTVTALYALALAMYGSTAERTVPDRHRAPWLAALFLACSPFAMLFAATAFTDPWLVLWLVVSSWAAVGRRPFWAGLALGLSIASKQQGVLGVPLVLALLFLWRAPGRSGVRYWTSAMLGCAFVLIPVAWWDSLRWATRPSYWDRSLTTYGPLALAPITQWPERATDWAQQLGYLYGTPLLSTVMLAMAGLGALGAAHTLRRQWVAHRRSPAVHYPAAGSQSELAGATELVFALWVGGYAALHFAFTFQPWDRYLLPISPFVALLAARGFFILMSRLDARWHNLEYSAAGPTGRSVQVRRRDTACRRGRNNLKWTLQTALVLLLALATWSGLAGKVPVGSDHGAYLGLDRLVEILRSQPADAVIYHRWLGWHYDFYLFDAPQERRWWGTAWKLADDAAATAVNQPTRPQWVALPSWEDTAAGELRLALAGRGLVLVRRETINRPDGSRSFLLYEILPARHGNGR